MIPFIKYSKIWLTISAIIAIASIAVLLKWGLKPGIDFTGGSLLEVSFSKARPAVTEVHDFLATDLSLKDSVIQGSGELKYIIRTEFLTEDQHQLALKQMRARYQTTDNTVREERFETIGASVSKQLRTRALWAIILVNLGIIIYVTYAFRKVSRPVASWKYGALAILALIHDILLVMGVFSVLGHYYGVEVDIAFVVALLIVLGFSVHDSIVVYDRTRENLLRHANESFADTINAGLNQTLMRSINTTMTTVLTLLALYFWGGATIHNFVLALLIGFTTGAYSSIFIATPMLVVVERWQRKSA